MNSRAAELIRLLGLSPHPEGGHFREVYRSGDPVTPGDDRAARPALTTIYFLLAAGETSRWHRVRSDEVWHHYEGDPLLLQVTDPGFGPVQRLILGPVGPTERPVHVVPAGAWQAARTLGGFTLVGCTVGPGFDFEDFVLLRDRPDDAATLRARLPDQTDLI